LQKFAHVPTSNGATTAADTENVAAAVAANASTTALPFRFIPLLPSPVGGKKLCEGHL